MGFFDHIFGRLVGRSTRKVMESLADGAIKSPLDRFDPDAEDIDIELPDCLTTAKLKISQLGEFCLALANSVEKGFQADEAIRLGRLANNLRRDRDAMLHFHLWEGDAYHELQVRMAKVAAGTVAMHFLGDEWTIGKVEAALPKPTAQAEELEPEEGESA